MGLTLGLIGGGGSILTVPILVYIFNQDPLQATASSLFIVGSTAAVGGLRYFLKKEVDVKIALLFSLPSFIGVYVVRKIVLPAIPDIISISTTTSMTKSFIVMITFSVIMLIASLKMILPTQTKPDHKMSSPISSIALFKIIFNGLLIGALAGFVGAGGGFLIIPALIMLFNLPMRIAVGSSLMIISIQSLLGFLTSTSLASVDWNFLFFQISLAVAGIFAGSYLSQFVSEKKLKTSFGYFALVVGILILSERLITTF